MNATEQPPQLYKGAETCDFRPEWVGVPAAVVPMLEACHAADPDDLTPQLVLADMLAEHDDPRERWVRTGVRLWDACGRLEPGPGEWDYQAAKVALGPACQTIAGWRLAGLWGCLVAWHAPAGDGSGRVMGRTWADARVFAVSRSLWWWGLGFLSDFLPAAWRQAYAAGRQADAAGRQAYAAWRQADAAWRQADAAGSQADAAGRQADAAGRQADAAWRQADAAGRQADAAWRQADAAGSQAAVWRFARSAWDPCVNELPGLQEGT